MIEEAADETRRVERDELVQHAGGQALLGERRRGHRAGGDEHCEILAAKALDQRNDRQHFADAGAVDPDQRTGRTRQRRFAVTLAEPRRDLPCRG